MSAAAITGMGVLHPFGRDADALWRGVLGDGVASRPIERFDADLCETRFAAQIPAEALEALPEPGAASAVRYALAALDDALRDAGLEHVSEPVAVYMGFENTIDFGPVARALAAGLDARGVDAKRLIGAWQAGSAQALEMLSHEPFLDGVRRRLPHLACVDVVCCACASGAEAIGAALRDVREGRVPVAVAGAADAKVDPVMLGIMSTLGMTSRRNDSPATASRPFDRSRDGIVVGEGAGAFVIESGSHARARGARIRARVTGFASSCDAWRLTDPAEDGASAAAAMRGALHDAGTDHVDYVNAHGTSTPMNDRAEVAALRRVFGDALPPVSSTKGATGHLMAASGAIEAAICVLALGRQLIPPTLHHREPDPRCDIDVTPNEPRPASLGRVLSNSFGIGGQNACLVLESANT